MLFNPIRDVNAFQKVGFLGGGIWYLMYCSSHGISTGIYIRYYIRRVPLTSEEREDASRIDLDHMPLIVSRAGSW